MFAEVTTTFSKQKSQTFAGSEKITVCDVKVVRNARKDIEKYLVHSVLLNIKAKLKQLLDTNQAKG